MLRHSQQQGTRGGAPPAAGEPCTEGTCRWREVPRYLFLTQPTLPQGSQGKIVSSSTSTGQQQELKCSESMRAHAPVPREAPSVHARVSVIPSVASLRQQQELKPTSNLLALGDAVSLLSSENTASGPKRACFTSLLISQRGWNNTNNAPCFQVGVVLTLRQVPASELGYCCQKGSEQWC